MIAVNKDYNSYFKVIKPEVSISLEGKEDTMKMVAILMNQGYVVTMYKDDPDMDIYCIEATYIGDNGYDGGCMAAFIDTTTEVSGAEGFPTEDVFPDNAEPLAEDDTAADDDSDNDPERWDDEAEGDEAEEDDEVYSMREFTIDVDYYGLGYSTGEFAHQNGREYDDGFYDEDYCMDDYDTYVRDCQAYAHGYADGWNDADVEDKPEAAEDEAEDGRRITDPFNRWAGRMPK